MSLSPLYYIINEASAGPEQVWNEVSTWRNNPGQRSARFCHFDYKDILAIKFMTQTARFCKSSFPGVNDAQMSYKSAT
jgi:hypothetical protein